MAVSTHVKRFGCLTCRFLQSQSVLKISKRTSAHKYTPVSTDFPNNRFTTVYRDIHGTVEDPGAARDFIYALKPNERSLLFNELKSFEDHGPEKEEDSYKTGPREVHPPTPEQLRKIALHNSLPFIGFGFFDNFLMITAGEYIDVTFGTLLGISTMAAAALGNLVSDLAGIKTAHYIEAACSKLGVRSPTLLPEQVDMKQTRWSSTIGKSVGISIGCIIGMFPLLFLNCDKDDKDDKDNKDDKDEDKKAST